MSPEERPLVGGKAPGVSASLPSGEGPAPSRRLPASRSFLWLRQFAKLWGFALFCGFVVFVFPAVPLPFLFAILVAYILAPLVDRMGGWRIGGRPFPRALAV